MANIETIYLESRRWPFQITTHKQYLCSRGYETQISCNQSFMFSKLGIKPNAPIEKFREIYHETHDTKKAAKQSHLRWKNTPKEDLLKLIPK